MYASLSTSGPVKWNHNQESTLFQHASPFEPAYDGRSTATLSERTRELYLQFLWLPESTMPLGQFVHLVQLLARPDSTLSSSPDDVHPLHPALDDILLTGNWCTYKYQEHLLPIVVAVASSHAHASSGADREASIMLFVLERHALLHEDQSASGERACRDFPGRQEALAIWDREARLSLSGKCPCIPARPVPMRSSHAQKRRRAAQRQSSSGDDDGGGGDRVEATPRSILEDRLEGLMDRLVLWQMALPDAEASADGTKTVRDWTQAFCDDVVQPAFAQKLPEQYKLLRRKLFRIPQWTSSSEDEGDSDGREQPQIRPSRVAAPPRIAQADMRRAEPKTRKVLQREVSMSKVFKGRRRNGSNAPPAKVEAEATMTTIASSSAQPQAKGPIVLVEGTPQKPKAKARKQKALTQRISTDLRRKTIRA
ncbi:hypothetical protein EDB86DRAFT_3135249 [Lactarius hatsudake]|nr:hypothetical protein EDB86DRAFT_3135249 [Lactarius hatsudake]